jgi:SAM-dependent methyltransferase
VKESHLEFYQRWHELAQPYFRWQFEQLQPYLGKRIADIGCGLGNLSGFMTDKDFYIGLDIDVELLKKTRNAFAHNRNMEYLTGSITDDNIFPVLKNKALDTVICVNVLEHIREDEKALGTMLSVLPFGGHLCLLVPAGSWNYGSLDKIDNHFRRYNKKMLADKLASFPVKIVKSYYFNMLGAVGWFIKGKVLRQQRQADDNYYLMNMILPFSRFIERCFRPPLGLSLIMIVEK